MKQLLRQSRNNQTGGGRGASDKGRHRGGQVGGAKHSICGSGQGGLLKLRVRSPRSQLPPGVSSLAATFGLSVTAEQGSWSRTRPGLDRQRHGQDPVLAGKRTVVKANTEASCGGHCQATVSFATADWGSAAALAAYCIRTS